MLNLQFSISGSSWKLPVVSKISVSLLVSQQGFRIGWFFADSDAYKWLDAAARIIPTHPNPKLKSLINDFIGLLSRAQMPDGYFYTYNQIHFPGTRWTNLQIEHELYCHGHLIEAGVSHHEAAGSQPFTRSFSSRG